MEKMVIYKVLDRLQNYRIYEDGRIETIRTNHIKSTCINSSGYLTIGVYREGRDSYEMIHRLLAEAFIPNPEGKSCVNHKDGNKQNNSLSNLEWMTHQENNQHAQDTGLNKARTSEIQKASVRLMNVTLKSRKVKFYHEIHGSFIESASELARIFPELNRRYLSNLVQGKTVDYLGWKVI
jgi:hypothetical protein